MDIVIANKKLAGSLQAPSSKSYAQRALFLALLAQGPSQIYIDQLSDDIQVALDMTSILADLTYKDRTYQVRPKKLEGPVSLNAGESGTCLRLIIPILASLGLKAKIDRQGTLVNRTLGPYLELLPQHGVNIKQEGNSILLSGRLAPGHYALPGHISSQFISGLLIALGALAGRSKISLTSPLESQPYVNMTIEMMRTFGGQADIDQGSYITGGGYKGTSYKTEGDWSSALFYLLAGVGVRGLKKDSLQADRQALAYLRDLGLQDIARDLVQLAQVSQAKGERILDARDMPDAVPALAIISAITPGRTKVINIARLRLKESDRVQSTTAMLEALGVDVNLKEDSFSFSSVDSFAPATIDSFQDHRIAMAGSIASSWARGPVTILGADCVSKSYANFYRDFKKLGGSYHVK